MLEDTQNSFKIRRANSFKDHLEMGLLGHSLCAHLTF